jgi:hydroxymethylglutaryl-CoA lyase
MTKPAISIVEVGPRDGLQNESKIMTVGQRVQLIDLLSDCGFAEIEVGSFVSPKWIPQMAHTDLVYRQIQQNTTCRYSVLVPNEQGMAQAVAAGVHEISIFTAASETFSQKNINCSIDESFERFKPLMKTARDQEIRVRGYVSCSIACPFEGAISADVVGNIAWRLMDLGCAEISLGDTIGQGTIQTIGTLVKTVRNQVPVEKLAIHCHDTYGGAIQNVLEALRQGIRIVDSAIYGLGGCPYATGKNGEKATGNVATEAILAALKEEGYLTNINEQAVTRASQFVDTWMHGN